MQKENKAKLFPKDVCQKTIRGHCFILQLTKAVDKTNNRLTKRAEKEKLGVKKNCNIFLRI